MPAHLWRSGFANPEDGAIKLALTQRVLEHRRENDPLYSQGAYRSIEPEGLCKGNLIVYTRSFGGRTLLVVAPRLVARLMGEDGSIVPIGREVWGDTRIVIPDSAEIRTFRDVLTSATYTPASADGFGLSMDVGELFQSLPLALLISEAV